MDPAAPRAPVDMRALRLPEASAPVWELVGRMREGMKMTLAEYLQIVEGLAFPSAPGVLRVVAEALAEAEAAYVIVGGFAVGALAAHPRATVDIDMIIQREHAPRFMDALAARVGPLEVDHYRSLERIKRPAIDLIISDPTALRRAALDPALSQHVALGAVGLRLPVPELAVVLKYASAVSRSRSAEDADQDLTDLRRLLKAHEDLDEVLLRRLTDTLHTRSPKELPEIIATLRSGGGVVTSRAGSRVQVTCVKP